jgi:hypothetical protein
MKEIKLLVKDINADYEIERRLSGAWKRPRESLKTLARRIGRYENIFHNIATGIYRPTFELVKQVGNALPWNENRRYDIAQKLLEAIAFDTGKIVIEVDKNSPEGRSRIKILARDAALEAIEQSKESENVK